MKRSIAALLVLALALALCACGGAEGLEGTWEIKSVSDGTQTVSVDTTPEMKGFIVLELREGGAGSITSGGRTTGLSWDESAITVEGDPAAYSLSGDTLTLYGGSYIFVFTRK